MLTGPAHDLCTLLRQTVGARAKRFSIVVQEQGQEIDLRTHAEPKVRHDCAHNPSTGEAGRQMPGLTDSQLYLLSEF